MYEVSRKEAFAAVTLIAIALTTIAWAYMSAGISTATAPTPSVTVTVDGSKLPSLDKKVFKNSGGTATGDDAINIDPDDFTGTLEIKVALIDLGGLYESMDQFTVVIWNATSSGATPSKILAVLTLEEPVATFRYVIGSNVLNLNMTVSWKAGSKVASTIKYGVAAEVVAAYP